VVCKVFVETRVRLVRWAFKVFLVFPAVSDQWESKAPLAQLVLQVLLDCAASKVSKDLLACVDHLELLVQPDQLACAARLDHRALKESRAQLE